MKTLFILTNSAGIIPQKILETESISIEKTEKYFISKNFKVLIYSYDGFISDYSKIKEIINGSYFFYASSQYPEYFSGFEDVLLLIKNTGGIIIPDFIHFRAHENKYFQELIKTQLQVKTPKSYLVSTIEEGKEKVKKIKFPIVAKLSSGFGSRSVTLLKSFSNADRYLNKNLTSVAKTRKNIYQYYKRIKSLDGKHPLKVGKIVLQEFIDGIENDWKIIIFGNKIFYLKRYLRENDFRASGSGNFDNTVKPDEIILKFAVNVKNLLKTPWVSLDIIMKDNELFLIEYQCVHFGLYTVLYSLDHFELINGKFLNVKSNIDVDLLFAEELFNYISNLNS